mmetsp:Transcript_134724/g.430454  ORF Transcript_134724/g.430454 Transcript_134724/m.430454 type:complete len:253 (+) Transcript_134724:1425-2183(+)
MTFALCAIIDSRWSEGWRLKSTTSPSRMCRSTVSPVWRPSAICRRKFLRRAPKNLPRPSTMRTKQAPGWASGPRLTQSRSRSRFASQTFSGNVMRLATHSGTTNSSTLTFGSGEMTVRPEKSTRFPLRLPRNRPSLPFSRAHNDRMGRPFGKLSPATSELIKVAHFSWRNCHASSKALGSNPLAMWLFNKLFASTISEMPWERSSSLVPLSPMLTVGLMQMGGTGTVVMRSLSGGPMLTNSRSCAVIILSKL